MNLSSVLILALGEAHLELEFPLQFLGFQLKSWMVWCCVVLVTLLVEHYFMTRRRRVYLVDFACYKPKPSCKGTKEVFMDRIISTGSFTQESIDFQRKVVEKSGLGPDDTFIAEAFLHNPPRLCMEEARKEAETVILGAIDEVLEKTGVNATDIGILVVNCSLFSPVPSLSSMVVNHYKLREDILSFNLGGMGCSASPISIDLAKNLLQVHRDSYALVVSMESMTLNWYLGNDKSMLVSNCLFRMGGAAILLSNKRSDLRRSKYELLHTVRTHKGSDDRSYGCVTQREDGVGKVGISLSKDLMEVAGHALRSNIISLGPLVLPNSEQIKYLIAIVARKVFHAKMKPYVPDFKLAFEHFCVHAGGRAVLDEVEKSLGLSKWHMEPSRMTLYRFGNVSSSSPWYELAYIEAKGRVKRGDRTWQIAFGSGFKCNSVVWRALKTVDPAKEKSPWLG